MTMIASLQSKYFKIVIRKLRSIDSIEVSNDEFFTIKILEPISINLKKNF